MGDSGRNLFCAAQHSRSLAWILRLVILTVALTVAGCAGDPEPAPEPPKVVEEPEVQPEPEPEGPNEEDPEPEAPSLAAYFLDSQGNQLVDGQSLILPTGAPPAGRIYFTANDPEARLYVTRDGTIPTTDNYWVGGIEADANRRPISSTVETARIYRILAVAGDVQSDPVMVRVNWQHEEEPSLDAPDFVVQGDVLGSNATLPVGGADDPAGRLYIESQYLGATIYVTNDGSDPSEDNYWDTGLSDGFYVFATQPFSTTYKAVAVVRGTESPVGSVTIEWVEQDD